MRQFHNYSNTYPIPGTNETLKVQILYIKGSAVMAQKFTRVTHRALLAGLVVVLLTVGMLLAIPSVDAQIRGLVQQFGLVVVDSFPEVHATTNHSSSNGQVWTSFEKAQQLVQFKIRLPQWLPEGITLDKIGAFPNQPDPLGNPAKPYQVVVAFQKGGIPQHTDPALTLDIRPASMGGGFLVDASKVENVSVNGKEAVFAQGTWNEHHEWQDDAKSAYLSWVLDDVQYGMNAVNLTKEEMLHIAESIR